VPIGIPVAHFEVFHSVQHNLHNLKQHYHLIIYIGYLSLRQHKLPISPHNGPMLETQNMSTTVCSRQTQRKLKITEVNEYQHPQKVTKLPHA